jgi:hypothetical protein
MNRRPAVANSTLILIARSLTLAILTLALTAFACGQGIMPFSTHVSDLVSSVDLATGAILVDIPIRSKVGSIPFDFHLIGNMSVWGGLGGRRVRSPSGAC